MLLIQNEKKGANEINRQPRLGLWFWCGLATCLAHLTACLTQIP